MINQATDLQDAQDLTLSTATNARIRTVWRASRGNGLARGGAVTSTVGGGNGGWSSPHGCGRGRRIACKVDVNVDYRSEVDDFVRLGAVVFAERDGSIVWVIRRATSSAGSSTEASWCPLDLSLARAA